MAFGQDFLNGFFGNEYLRDYTHASKVFRSNGYANAPRLKFLFHVYFTLNDAIPQVRNQFKDANLSVLVKTVELPRYRFDVDTLNQYNRKRIIQKKIEYQPVNLTFHDDGGDLIRRLWYTYYSYYIKDPSQPYNGVANTPGTNGPSATQATGFGYNNRDIYANDRRVNDWGYIGESYYDGTDSATGKPQFFKDITIYGFNQHKWVSYVLINPLITDWTHDTYDYSLGDGVLENRMTLAYETVKYYGGGIGGERPDTNVPNFASPQYYDQRESPLRRPGGTRSILGQGGLLDTGIGIVGDLEQGTMSGVLGAVQKAGTAYNTFRGVNLGAVAREEALGQITQVLRNTQQGTTGGLNVPQIANALQKPIFPTPNRG